MNYTSIFRTKRHYNFQKDFDSEESFDKEAELTKKEIVWAILINCQNGEFVKKINGYYA